MKKLLLISSLLLPMLMMGQGKWEGGILLGGTSYLGDLAKPQFVYLPETNIGYGALVRYNFKPNWALRAGLTAGKLTGRDANFDDRASRGFSFEMPYAEAALMLEYDLFGKKRFAADGNFYQTFSPYVFGGVGMLFRETKTVYQRNNPALFAGIDIDEAADKNSRLPSFPLGIGLRYDITKTIVLGVEGGYHLTASDYLDGISEAGNPDLKDNFLFGGISFTVRFGAGDADKDGIIDTEDECPDVAGLAAFNGCPDTDGDGVADRNDACPQVAGSIKTQGCPDADGDGIADAKDQCPDKPGTIATNGCPDTDGDGIMDNKDDCPEKAGTAAFNGCPDTDGDGIGDNKDKCPEEKGVASNFGCPEKDTDGDGLADSEDMCPDKAGLKENKGCPDTDFDGVHDGIDKCPTLAGAKNNQGCPEVKEDVRERLRSIAKSIQFETGKDVLMSNSKAVLDEVADIMSKYPSYNLRINGHTDNVGDDGKNMLLSDARAKATYQYLINKGISDKRLFYKGYGETVPVGDNAVERGRALNRRVELDIFQP